MKAPLAIWVTDTHLSENTIEINFKIFAQIFALCKEFNVKYIFHGGDIFNSRKGQSEVVLNAFKSIIDQAAEHKVRILAIPGNHDKTSYVAESSFIDAFDGHPGFTVLAPGASMFHENVSIYFMPYFDETLAYADKIEALNKSITKDGKNILLTHVGVDGVKTNSGITVKNEIKQELFDAFDLVLIGHYHNRQLVSDKIVYTGSAYQGNFGEDEEKGCVLINDDGSYEFINLDFPKFVTVDILPQDLTKDLIMMVNSKSSEANVRIRIQEEIGEDKKGLVKELENVGAKVLIDKEAYKPIENIGQTQVSFTNSDILEIYDNWAQERRVENAEYGKNILQNVL